MRLYKQILTNNNCYKDGKKLYVKGIMWHSTGANNPNLCRYVQPDDGILGVNKYNNSWNQPQPGGRNVCVHAFIGKDKNGDVATYQTLPWDMQAWHSGTHEGNAMYIGFEICEDNLKSAEYFNTVYKEACELTVYLCEMFNLDPLKDGVVICHSEGYKRGIASNHSDVMHWFPKYGKSMDTVRRDVAELLGSRAAAAQGKTPIVGKTVATTTQMRNYIQSVNPNIAASVIDMIPLYNTEGVAENIRGDIAFAQSCLETGNFTFAGSAVTLDQNNFCGHGVTSRGKKGNSFISPQIGIRAQIQHLKAYANEEPLNNPCVDNRFDYVTRGSAPFVEYLGIQENPHGKGWAAGANYGEKILNILERILKQPKEPVKDTPYLVRVNITDLNIRSGPGTNYSKVGRTGIGTFTIVDEADGKGASRWGKLKSGAGWISLDYAKRV